LSAGRALTVQARAARNQGDLAAASAAASAALKLFQTLNDRHSVISIQLLSGNLAAIAGRYDEAERRLQAGIDAERSLNRPWTLANSGLGKLQMVYFFSGRFQQALAPLAEYRQLSEEYGFAWGLAQSGISMGLLHLHLGEYANGQKQGENILGQIKEHGLLDFFACETLALLAQVKIALGEFEAAGAYLQECDALCDTRPVGMPTYVAGNHLYWGIIAAVEGDLAAAWEHLQSELESAVARKDRLNMANALGGGAFLYAMGNEASPALEHYSLAFQHPFVANSRWFEELIGERVQSACESLSAAEAEAIRVRASGMDLEASAATMLAQWKSPSAKKPVAAIAGAQPLLDPPSQRELELLQLVAEGKSNREIAAELFLALGTVKSHLHNIYQKLGASNRTQAINRAKELGLL
jgi:ATP/maltotriose-dependent transcriptional regulator MalT